MAAGRPDILEEARRRVKAGRLRKYWTEGPGSKKMEDPVVEEVNEGDGVADCDPTFEDSFTKADVEEPEREPGEFWHSGGKTYIADGDGNATEVTATSISRSLTGSSVPTHSVGGAMASGGMISRRITTTTPTYSPGGGMVGGGGSMGYPWTTTTTTTGMPVAAPKPKKRPFVRMPSRFTRKVLVGFLDPDEKDPSKDVEWAANLPLVDAEISMRDGKMELVLTLSLEDIYDNNPEESED